MAKHMSYEDRFFQKVNKTDKCWLWTGALNSRGYGCFSIDRKSKLAHRYSYEIYKGEIPKGMYVCHACDVPNCVNPDHLWLGTASDNIKDMFKKDRQGSSNRQKTHCKRGHSFEKTGIYIKKLKDGKTERHCAECARQRKKRKTASSKLKESFLKYEREYQKMYNHYRKK